MWWLSLALACPETVTVTVRGDSLRGVADPGAELVLETGACVDIARNDIVAFVRPRREAWVVKQVRGVPGDTVTLDPLAVNGVVLESRAGPYRLTRGQRMMLDQALPDGIVPENAYVVLGTDPRAGEDSTRFGLLRRDDIVGRAASIRPLEVPASSE